MTAVLHRTASGADEVRLGTLRSIERRLLWLSTAMIDHANHRRPPDPAGIKVGGHQASSASVVTIMTALWFHALGPDDRVSVKPHASPVLHAVNFLLGDLGADALGRLRQYGGLQSYPSRTKDPDPVDYSTGSVGIGATAPLWGAVARRYVESHFGGAGTGRQYSLLGDAELDEGACWEAMVDPVVPGLGELVWIVDVNRQSLDRVVPAPAVSRLERMFSAAGWQTLTVKYGDLLQGLFERPGGGALRDCLDAMGNPEYQAMIRSSADQVRAQLASGCRDGAAIAALLAGLPDELLLQAVRDLGGHSMASLVDAFDSIDDSRPTVIFAYTVKGFGLPSAGHPANHSALLGAEQMAELAGALGADPDDPWAGFDPASEEDRLCRSVAERLHRTAPPGVDPPGVPVDLPLTSATTGSTQEALGRMLVELTRAAPEVARRVVTASPDVASSTNLGGWINKVGVWAAAEAAPGSVQPGGVLQWTGRASGQHLELGIAETNLMGLLGELGATWSRWGQPLLPIGTVYDPFVTRAAEPWSFGLYAGGQSILVGTPSGVTLAPEGGAHQSVVTPGLGVAQPACTAYEPAFAQDLVWCMLDALGRLGRPGGRSSYFRLSTRPVDQRSAKVPEAPGERERRRRQVVSGGYVLRPAGGAVATIVAMGAVVPEALAAAGVLDQDGVAVEVVCVTSADLLFRALQSRRALDDVPAWILDELFPADARRPMVTVLDGHPSTLAFLATVRGVPGTHLGVSDFGSSGDLASVYRAHGIDSATIVGATFDLLDGVA